MGDKRRFQIFGDFIIRNFPKKDFPRIADVAGGQGYLSYYLSQKGYDCTVFDMRKTHLSKPERTMIKRGLRTPFKRIVGIFRPQPGFDLIVGLHPDGATEDIVDCATFSRIAIVPCCNYWRGIESHGTNSVTNMIKKRIKVPFLENRLPMNGKNICIMSLTTIS